MEQIDYKEKYEQAMERARQFSEKPYLEDSAGIVEYIFPELKESEDERIRNLLISGLELHGRDFFTEGELDMIFAWLEKQKGTEREIEGNSLCNGEQKPADKVEPKFHEGDMIIHKELGGDYIHNPHKIIQVDILDKKYRLEGGLVAHFGEQDDYELVEQKTAWSEEDESMLYGVMETEQYMLDVVNGIKKFDVGNASIKEDCTRELNWLKSLRDRVQPQLKQGWSEEDENRINRLIAYFEDKESFTAEDDIAYANWLKTLKDRYTWKPSGEQMDALLWCVAHLGGADNRVLGELYEHLKKLREE